MSEIRDLNPYDPVATEVSVSGHRSGSSGTLGQQEDPCRQHATAKKRIKWTRKDNVLLFECYCKSEPERRGYRKRLFEIWKNNLLVRDELRDVSEQRLCDQIKQIKSKGWLTELEQRNICERVMNLKEGEVLNEESMGEGSDFVGDEVVSDNDQRVELIENNDHVQHDYTRVDELTNEELEMRARLVEALNQRPEVNLINLKTCDRTSLSSNLKRMNNVLKTIRTENISEDNSLMYAAAYVISDLMGKVRKEQRVNIKKEPFWKRRIFNSIKTWRKDLSRLEELQRGRLLKERERDQLNHKYKLNENGTRYICEMLRQKIRAGSVKIKRYEDRNKQYRQNVLFQTNQKRFYDELDNRKGQNITPNPNEATEFWSNIWSDKATHNIKAEWINEIERDLSIVNRQEDLIISKEDVKKCASKMACWKAPGLDGLQGFWFKRLDSMHDRLSKHLQKCLVEGDVPSWMVKGKTVLVMKDPSKGNEVGNYRPIACLPLMWKLLTSIFAEKIYEHLEENELLVDEQKGCRRKTRGTKDQLMIDKAILKNAKRRHANLAMGWIDYRKAYDMVPHSWITKCIEMFGIARNMDNLIKKSMDQWQTVLTSNGETLGNVEINRGIFQGDSLSPLLFVLVMTPLTFILRKTKVGYKMSNESQKINHLLFMDDLKLYASNKNQLESLVNTVRIYSRDIKMEFGLSKCAILELYRGKHVRTEEIDLGEDGTIKEADPTGYKYLGILQLDQMLEKQMKVKIKDEYFKRVKKVCRSKLNGGNLIDGINSWAVGVVRYGAGIISWTKEELREMDRKTRKIMSLNRALHVRSNVGRLYLPRNKGGRGLQGIEDCVGAECASLCEYIYESTETMIIEARKEGVIKPVECLRDYKERVGREHLSEWKDKALHGKFYQAVEGFADSESWRWLRQGYLKKETEGMICAAQEQALRTNSIKYSIDKTVDSPLCRKCKLSTESVQHIISGCTPLTQSEYKTRHDKVASRLHWEVCKEHGLEHAPKWYEHVPQRCQENEKVKVLWDMTFFSDKKLPHNRPDISIFDKNERKWKLIDVAVPFDGNVPKTENEKVDRYQDLVFEIDRLYRTPAEVIPIVVGALGTVTSNLMPALNKLEMGHTLGSIQMTALLHTAHILRKVLQI